MKSRIIISAFIAMAVVGQSVEAKRGCTSCSIVRPQPRVSRLSREQVAQAHAERAARIAKRHAMRNQKQANPVVEQPVEEQKTQEVVAPVETEAVAEESVAVTVATEESNVEAPKAGIRARLAAMWHSIVG